MKRAFAYLLLILAAFFLQNNIFAASHLILTVPNIMLILVFSFGFIRGSVDGMCIGFVCGLLLDIFFSETLGFSALMAPDASKSRSKLRCLSSLDMGSGSAAAFVPTRGE